MRKKIIFAVIIFFLGNKISAFDISTTFHFINCGVNLVYYFHENEGSNVLEFTLGKVYFYDRDSRFGLDLSCISFNHLLNLEDIMYYRFLNLDFNYSPLGLVDTFYFQVYISGGPSTIIYTTDSDEQISDTISFDVSSGVRLRLINYNKLLSPNIDLFCEYNFIKNNIKVGFSTRLLTPVTMFFKNETETQE